MRPGPPPQPNELKRRRGNPGKRPLPASDITAIAPVTVIEIANPSAPSSGDDLTRALLEAGAASWVGQTDRLALLAMLRDGWDERAYLRSFIAENGRSYESFSKVSGVQYHDRPEVRQLAALEKQITTWLSLLGLTPADRSRLGVAEVKAQSRLEALAEKRAARLAGRRVS